MAAALLFPLAATVTNAVRSGEWILISANSGINLWIGNNPDTDQTVAVRPGAGWEELVEEPNQHGVVSPGDQNTYFTGKAVDFCLEKPLACLGNLLWKARLLLVARELPRNEDLYVVRGQSPVLWVLTARAGPVALPYVLIIPLGAAGAWWTFHRGKGSRKNRPDVPAAPREARLLVWSTLALALAPVVFFVTGRYRAPMAPLLSALAALGVYALWIGRRRAWKGMVTAELALLLSVWPVELPVDGIDFEAELHYAVGGRRARLGDDAGAVEALRRAVEKRPDYTEARFNLGLALERLGRWDDATEAYRGILLRSPDHEPSKTRLDVLHSLGH